MSSITTRTGLTDHCISNHPQAALRRAPVRLSDRFDETGSEASYTSMCRSRDVTAFSAPTGIGVAGERFRDHDAIAAICSY
jgi:hypothetical protein